MSTEGIVLGRGLVYFDRFLEGSLIGEGERYIGNTTGFAIRRELDEIERQVSIKGVISKRDDLITREKITGDFVTDNISIDNASTWFGSRVEEIGQSPIGFITETFTIKRGRYYQLGRSYNPVGTRHVEGVTFSVNGNPLPIVGELTLDKVEGRFLVLSDAATLNDGDVIDVTFEWRASPAARSWGNEAIEVEGALRFISTNPVGPRKNYFFPHVTIKPSGEANLKSDEWQQLAFAFEAKRISPRHAQMYATNIGEATYTDDELAIIELSGVSLDEFPFWDDQLNIIINTSIPSRNY